MIAPPGTQSQPLSSRTSTARVYHVGGWPWHEAHGSCARCCLLANFVASIPAYYRTHADCLYPPKPGAMYECLASLADPSGRHA